MTEWYSIGGNQKQYRKEWKNIMNYTIRNDQLTVVLKTMSGTFTSIKKGNREYLWQGSDLWKGQSPICFPICGSLRKDTAETEDGKVLKMGRHGFVRKREFALKEQTDVSASFTFTSSDETKKMYPYDFVLTTSYRLDGNKIHVSYDVTNTGSETLPFNIGGHTGYACPLDEGESYSDYEVEFEKEEQTDVPTPVAATNLLDSENRMAIPMKGNILPLSHELFDRDLLVLDRLKSKWVYLHKKGEKKGVRVSFDAPNLVLWSAKGQADFLAIEPWQGNCTCENEDDVFDHKPYVQYAAPGETKGMSFTVEIID